ncbi:unnamed protein product, partial [Meganyctiphanes norvegica]
VINSAECQLKRERHLKQIKAVIEDVIKEGIEEAVMEDVKCKEEEINTSENTKKQIKAVIENVIKEGIEEAEMEVVKCIEENVNTSENTKNEVSSTPITTPTSSPSITPAQTPDDEHNKGLTTVGTSVSSVKWVAGTTYNVGAGVVGTAGKLKLMFK